MNASDASGSGNIMDEPLLKSWVLLPFVLSSSVEVKDASKVARGAVCGSIGAFPVGVLGVASLDLSLLFDSKDDERENFDSLILSRDRDRSFVPLFDALEVFDVIDSL